MNLQGLKEKALEVLTSPETLSNSSKVAVVSGWLTVATAIENVREHGSFKKETGLAAATCVGSAALATVSALSK